MGIKKNGYITKSIFTLVSSSALGQIITVIASPIITRIYNQYELGMYTLLLTMSTMIAPVLSLRYEMEIVLESDEKNLNSIVQLALILNAVISFITSLFMGLYYYYTGYKKESFLFFIIVFWVNIITGFINVIVAYNNRRKEYKIIANGYVIRMLIQNIGMVAFGILNCGLWGIAISQIIGCLVNALYQYMKSRAIFLDFKIDMISIKSVLLKYKNQALYSSPAALVNGISYSIINFYIDFLYGAEVLGVYSISYRVLGIPTSIIAGNVSKVFFETASKEYKSKGNFFDCYRKTIFLLAIFAIPLFLLMYILAVPLCEFFFGEGWRAAGEYIKILTIMFCVRFIAGGVNCSAIIASRTKIDLLIQIILVITGGGAFTVVFLLRQNIVFFLKIINLLYALIYIVYIGLYGICAKYPKEGEKNFK